MARDITVTFEDGSEHVYKGAPDDVTPDQIEARAERDFADKTVKSLDGGRGKKETAAPPPPPPPKRKVGFLESAGRQIGQAATTAVGHLGMAAAGVAGVLGEGAQDAVFRARDKTMASMADFYGQKPDEEFNTAGSLVGGVASAPIEIVGGGGAQHGTERATQVLDRGGSLGDAALAGGVSGATHVALNALPVKAGGAVGRAIETKLGGMAGGAATGAVIAGGGGAAGRAAENAALPEGKQFEDLQQPVMPSAAEVGMGAAFGAVPGAAKAGSEAVRAAGERRRAGEAADKARQMKQVETAVNADIPVAPHQLSGNKFLKYLGETLEHVPLSGGATNRETRSRNYSAGLAKAIDPESTAVKLDDKTFDALQDKAGERIGEIYARTDIPKRAFGDLMDVGRRDTPDVQQVIKTYADDLQTVAAQNGGVVPGTTLRKLRTEAQTQARTARANKGDLAAALDRVVHRFDEALSEHAADGDMPALLEARRQYAVSKAIEPVVAKHPDGNIPTQTLMTIVTRKTGGGQTRMAKGKGGELGDYAEMGAKLLREQASSGTGERNLIYRVATDAAEAAKVGVLWAPATLYNAFGPKVVKRMIEKARRDQQRTEPPPLNDVAALANWSPDWETSPGAGRPREPGIDPTGMVPALGEEPPLPQGVPQRPGSQIPVQPDMPLGDLTMDPGTSPGAAPPAGRVDVVPTDNLEGVVPPPGQLPAPGRIVRSGDPRMQRAEPQMPAVPGRPGLPDTMVGETFAPGDVFADQATIDASGTPNAQLARRGQVTEANAAQAARERAEPVPAGQATELPVQDVQPAPTPEQQFNQQYSSGEGVQPAGAEPAKDQRLADIERLRAGNPSKEMAKALDEAEAEVKRAIKVEKRNQERMQTAAEMRAAADQMADPKMAQALRDRADRTERPALAAFQDLAKKHKLPPKAVDAALKSARQMPAEEVGAFFQRYIEALARKGAVENPIPPKDLAKLDDQTIPVGEAKELHGGTPVEKVPAGEAKEVFVDEGRKDTAAKPAAEKPEKPAEPAKPAEKPAGGGKYPVITSQAEYDKLKAGEIYSRGGDKLYRKR